MTTGAMIVGIIGGVVGLIIGIIAWTIASFLGALLTLFHIDGSGIALLGFLVLALAVVGLVGGALAKAKPLAAGILMLIGGGGGFPLAGWFWLFPGILLIIGGILAIVGHMGEPKPVEIGAKAAMATGSSYPRARAIRHQPEYRGPEEPVTARLFHPGVRLTVRNGPRAGQSFAIGAGVTTIGRSRDNTVVVEDPTVSRHHARITQEGPNSFLEDLGSSAGTMLDGTPVRRPARLTPGSVIRLGNTELAFEAPAVARPVATEVSRQPQTAGATIVLGREKGAAWLLVQKGAKAGQSLALQGDIITIGQPPNSTIRLEDLAVSRHHALIRRVAGRYVLYDGCGIKQRDQGQRARVDRGQVAGGEPHRPGGQ